MERSALYRRALAPIMTFAGILGIAATVVAEAAHARMLRAFVALWAVVSVIAVIGAFFLVRRQAIRDAEPLWSPPTRRVAQALAPCLVVGAAIGGVCSVYLGDTEGQLPQLLAIAWVILYGCALHSAGFFMTRGIKLFGWAFIFAGAILLFAQHELSPVPSAHWIMGFFFGVLHLAYGIYLYFTEKRRSAA